MNVLSPTVKALHCLLDKAGVPVDLTGHGHVHILVSNGYHHTSDNTGVNLKHQKRHAVNNLVHL